MSATTFSNPRLVAEFQDWPLGGNKRGYCKFWVEFDKKRGYRVGRQTTGKPKFTTYGGQACLVDGSDGRTYVLIVASLYDFITIKRSDFLDYASVHYSDNPHRDFDSNILHYELTKLIAQSGAVKLSMSSTGV